MSQTNAALAIRGVQVGPVAPLGADGVASGIVKRPVAGPVEAHALGIAGDGVADLSVHGGPDKAIYAYPLAHYAAWAQDMPEHAGLWGPGAVGENLTVEGLLEDDVHIGDVFEGPSGLQVQVSQPRQPCFKLGLRFGDERLPQAMILNGRCGWYLRVLRPGALSPGDAFSRISLGEESWTVARFQRVTTVDRRALTREVLAELADLEPLSQVWRSWARARLDG